MREWPCAAVACSVGAVERHCLLNLANISVSSTQPCRLPVQVTPKAERRVVDFGTLVVEGFRAQELEHQKLASAAAEPLSDTGAVGDLPASCTQKHI